ncbi:MAG: TolC family protein [Muribaculaceae bacterium]|nr:TolC family protein [Muribaculaceae bacterium]
MNLKSIIIAALSCMSSTVMMMAVTVNVDSCVVRALATDAGLKVAVNAVAQAKLNRGVARTAYFPNFSGSATTLTSLPDTEAMGMTLRLRGVYMAGINLTQPVFAGGKIIAANKLAGIGVEAAEEQLRLRRMQVIADAESSYWTYVAVLAKVEMMRSYLAQIDTAYSQTRTSFDAGMITRNDLLRIEARKSQVKYQLGQVENGADLCRMSLCHVMGLEPDTYIEPADADVPVEIPADLENYNLEMRPETALLQADVRAKRQQVNMTRADFLPVVGIQAGWSAYGNIKTMGYAQGPDGNYYPFSQNTKGTGWSFMASVSVPLWHWGEGIRKVKHAKLDVENARITLDDNLKLMNIEIRQAISNVRTGSELLESARIAMSQARLNLSNLITSYNLGMSPLTDLLDAQSQWHTSYSNLIEAATQLRIYCVEYMRVTGRLER